MTRAQSLLSKAMGPQQAVSSSNVKSMAYDPEREIMMVNFHHGGSYFYYDVPPDVFNRVRGADSVGRSLYNNVKDQYDYRRVGKLRRAMAWLDPNEDLTV